MLKPLSIGASRSTPAIDRHTALDVSVQAEILNLLKRLRAERNLTFLLVTHNLPVVSFLCDRLAVMRRGRIVEVATVQQLKDNGLANPYSRELAALSGSPVRTPVEDPA